MAASGDVVGSLTRPYARAAYSGFDQDQLSYRGKAELSTLAGMGIERAETPGGAAVGLSRVERQLIHTRLAELAREVRCAAEDTLVRIGAVAAVVTNDDELLPPERSGDDRPLPDARETQPATCRGGS